jgi:uncharacterized membrane protein (DUF2068 family)
MENSGPDRRHAPVPEVTEVPAIRAGLRAVATFEASKGLLVLLLGLGLLDLLHRDVEETAENLLWHFHIDPDRRLARVILDAGSNLTDARLWTLAGTAVAYASVRFAEAWGLWNRRSWAQWFALLSGALYLPWEVSKLGQRVNWVHTGVLVGNVLLLMYMGYLLLAAHRRNAGEAQ